MMFFVPIMFWFGVDAVRRALDVNFTYLENQTAEILSVVSQGDSVVLMAAIVAASAPPATL